MKISTRLRLAVYVPSFMALVIIGALVFSYQETARMQRNGDTVRQIRSSITELNHFVFSYTLYHEERPVQQFMAEYEHLTQLITGAQFRNPERLSVLKSIRENTITMNDLFLQLVTARGQEGTSGAEERLAGLLLSFSFLDISVKFERKNEKSGLLTWCNMSRISIE